VNAGKDRPYVEQNLSPALGWLLYNVSREFSSSLDLDKLLSSVLSFTVQVFDATVGSIFLLDSRGRITKSILARQNLSPEVSEQTVVTVMEKGFGEWVYRHAKADIISDTRQDSRWISLPDNPLITLSAVSAPLIRLGQVTGIVTLHHPEPNHFDGSSLISFKPLPERLQWQSKIHRYISKVMDEHFKLKQLDALKNEFVNHAANDLKSSLHIIYSYAELLRQFSGLNKEGQEFAREIQTAINRMKSIISNVLDINRIEMGIESELEPPDITAVIRESAATFYSLALDRKISLALDVSEGLPLVKGASVRIGQVLMNLVGNAIKFALPAAK